MGLVYLFPPFFFPFTFIEKEKKERKKRTTVIPQTESIENRFIRFKLFTAIILAATFFERWTRLLGSPRFHRIINFSRESRRFENSEL